ncbi:MAG: hypothetical protein M3Q23_05460 [Actinomycetota bacterium]|nr:hypothetical protein [Actinomycetota bacterium]
MHDELALLAPQQERDLPSGRLAAHRRALVEHAAGTGASGGGPIKRRRRSWRVALVLVPAALLGTAVAVASGALRTADQVADEVTCFAAPDLGSAAAGFPSAAGQSLAAQCEHAWTSGGITSPAPGPAPAVWIACVGQAGGVDVFPSEDAGLCGRLGLQPLPPDYGEAVARYAALEQEMFASFPESECIGRAAGMQTARRILDDHGYTSWTVRAGRFSDDAPCGRPDLDPVNGIATLEAAIRPELADAVQGTIDRDSCGPQADLLRRVQDAVDAAGFSDWTVTIDHQLSSQWPCVAGFNPDPAARQIVLAGHATGG